MSTLLLFALMIAPWWPTAIQTWKKSYLFSDTDSVSAGSFFLSCFFIKFIFIFAVWEETLFIFACWMHEWVTHNDDKVGNLSYANVLLWNLLIPNSYKQIPFTIWLDIYYYATWQFEYTDSWVLTLSRGFSSFFISMFICLSKVKCE